MVVHKDSARAFREIAREAVKKKTVDQIAVLQYMFDVTYTLLPHLLDVYLAIMMRSQASICRDYIRVRAEGPFTCVSSRANMRVLLCRKPCLDPAGGAYCTRYVLLKIDGGVCRIM